MSEKATLLTSIPPIKKSTASGDAGSSGSGIQSAPKAPSPTSSPTKSLVEKKSTQVSDSSQSATNLVQESEVTETVAVASDSPSITLFQGVIYVSFVLTFCLAGFGAVVLFRKAGKCVEARFKLSAKVLGGAFAWAALSGFFATYLYANYLNGQSDSAPLSFMLFFWVLAGPMVGYVLNQLLTPGNKPDTVRIAIDAAVYVGIFASSMLAVASGIKENAALLFSLLGGFLFIVPVARYLSLFKTAKARHPELRDGMDQALVYALLIIPGLFPILAFARVCGLSADLFIFLSNFLSFDFVLVVACSMIACLPADEEAKSEAEATESAAESEASTPQATVPQPVAPTPVPPAKEEVVRELKPKKLAPLKPPSIKPSVSGGASNGSIPSAPQKPSRSDSAGDSSAAPNAPSRIKAPAKPKKRF